MATITHIFKTYFPDTYGGLEEAIRQIGKYSIYKGFDVNVISISRNPQEIVLDGIRCHSYKRTCGISTMPISYNFMRQFKKIVETSDIIQLHYPFPFAEIITLCQSVKKPIIVTFHGEIIGRNALLNCYHPFVRKLFDKVDVIVPTSQNLVTSTSILQKFESKLYIINLWLDQDRFEHLSDVDEEFKAQIKLYNDFSLFVGALRWYKGLDVLLDAAKQVKGNILIVGKGPEGKYLEERIKKEKITNVFLLGFQPDERVAYLFKQCKFFVLPSQTRGECFGQVLLEASYYKKAMISTELGTGTSFVNKNGLTGYVVQPGDPKELANKMNKLFWNEELCISLGENAYKYYNSHFTENIQGEKYVDLYKKLLDRSFTKKN